MSEHSTPAGAHLECCTLFSARKETEGTGQEGAAESSQGRQRHRPRLPQAEASGRARRRRAARGCRPGRGAARPAGPDPGPRAGRRRGAAGSAGGLPPPPCGRHGVRDSLGTLAERQVQVMQPPLPAHLRQRQVQVMQPPSRRAHTRSQLQARSLRSTRSTAVPAAGPAPTPSAAGKRRDCMRRQQDTAPGCRESPAGCSGGLCRRPQRDRAESGP